MRQDQYEKLQQLTEKLTDVFLQEADPDKWPGAALESGTMDQQTRGDRYWCKKNAAATLTVIMKTSNLVSAIQLRSAGGEQGGAAVPEAEAEHDTLDAEVAAAEKEAMKLMNQAVKRAKKTAFDKKTHGKT